jgi:hypothetical protein
VKTVEKPKKKNKQILWQEIVPNSSKDRPMHERDNPSFLDEFMKFFFTVLFIFVFLSLST